MVHICTIIPQGKFSPKPGESVIWSSLVLKEVQTMSQLICNGIVRFITSHESKSTSIFQTTIRLSTNKTTKNRQVQR